MILRSLFTCQAVQVFVLLSTAGTALTRPDGVPSQPVANPGDAGIPAAGSPPVESSYQAVQSRNVYTYPMGKQYTTYAHTGSPSNQYGSAPLSGGNAGNDYSATGYRNGAPPYADSYNVPYNYYVAHSGEPSASADEASYQAARSEAEEGLQPVDDNSYLEFSPNGMKAANRAFNPDGTIIGSAKRSLLDLTGQPELHTASQAGTSLTSALPGFLDQARVQLSFSGGYPSNSPRYTYLTFVIPGDICTLNQQDFTGAGSIDAVKSVGAVGLSSLVNQPLAYGSTYSTYTGPGSLTSGYDASSRYQYGSSVQSRTTYSNGPTVGLIAPMQVGSQAFVGGLNGGVAGGAASLFKPGVRSLDGPVQNPVDSKPPPSPAPASVNAKPNEDYTSGTRTISK